MSANTKAERELRLDLILKARDAGMHPKHLAPAVESLMEGHGVLETARRVGISKNTATRLFAILKPHISNCPCGRLITHRGHCTYRLQRDGRSKRHVVAGRLKIARRNRFDELLNQIEQLVPKALPKQVRDEMRQNVALTLLSGRTVDVGVLRKQAYSSEGFSASPNTLSYNELTASGWEPNEWNSQPRLEEHPDETFDFNTHCFGCGERGHLRRLHGHTQCMNCGCITEPCCGD